MRTFSGRTAFCARATPAGPEAAAPEDGFGAARARGDASKTQHEARAISKACANGRGRIFASLRCSTAGDYGRANARLESLSSKSGLRPPHVDFRDQDAASRG